MLSELSQAEKDKYHVFTHMWNLRNLTEGHGGREGEKQFQTEREAKHKRLLENKLRVDGWEEGRGEGKMVDGRCKGHLLG